MSIPTAEDDESLEEEFLAEDSTDRRARYADDRPRPVRDSVRFRGVQPRRDRPDRQLGWGPLLAAAGAGFLIAIVFGPCRSTDPQREEEVANLKSELQTARDRAAKLESQLSGGRESVDAPDAPEADAPERAASEPEPQTAPAPEREGRSELAPDEVSRKEPIADPEAAKATELSEARTPTLSNPSQESSRTPDRVALAEPQHVAAVSVYDSPDPAAPVVRSTSRSNTPGLAVLQALAPEQAGWTTEAQPTIYWHASRVTRFPCEFKLIREGTDEPLVRVQLPPPNAAGIQRIELSQFGISLDEGASYRWSVSLVDLEDSGADRATGGIRRVAPPETLRAIAITGAAPAPERLDALERAGLWYDALDLVTRSIERNPGAENLVARRNAMLARVGIHLTRS